MNHDLRAAGGRGLGFNPSVAFKVSTLFNSSVEMQDLVAGLVSLRIEYWGKSFDAGDLAGRLAGSGQTFAKNVVPHVDEQHFSHQTTQNPTLAIPKIIVPYDWSTELIRTKLVKTPELVKDPIKGTKRGLGKIIAGSDPRGSHLIYDISEQIGESLVLVGSVPIRKRDEIFVLSKQVEVSPSVKYRGMPILKRDESPIALSNLEQQVLTLHHDVLVVLVSTTLLGDDYKWINIRHSTLAEKTDRADDPSIHSHLDNVGDLRKPKEIPISQLQDLAYDMTLGEGGHNRGLRLVSVSSAVNTLRPITDIMDRAYGTEKCMLPAATELLEPQVYSVINYHEAEAILDIMTGYFMEDTRRCFDKLDSEYQPAFFDHAAHPVLE
ncbi:hypothetical protein CEK25_002883 [Fusarium fujikuroi]|nr:hypothetical protein CEK25_002883 [Fusarium fujikuroi]